MRNILLILFIFILWGAGSAYWYVCKIKGLCDGTTSVSNNYPKDGAITKDASSTKAGNLVFKYKGSVPETNYKTRITLDSLKALNPDTLLIEGLVFKGEVGSLGIARAENIRQLLLEVDFNKPIITRAVTKDTSLADRFVAHRFVAVYGDDQSDTEPANQGFTVEKTADKITIYFPVASADPHTDDALIKDLKALVSITNENKHRLQVIGHTDDTGTPEINLQYGQRRADAIMNLLVEYGMSRNAVSSKSLGETQPIASNDSEANRRKNRRVEVITIKQ